MTFRRGFKSEANGYARDFRKELELEPYSPLCPWTLAAKLEIPLMPLSIYRPTVPETVAYFETVKGQKDLSAITLFERRFRWVVYNDAHHKKRQAADIAHELAHCILQHPPKPPFNAEGSRHYDEDLEAEANWLGPTLLVSEEAALMIVKSGMTLPEASDHYGVSMDLVRMRLNVTGAAKRVARRGAAYVGPPIVQSAGGNR